MMKALFVVLLCIVYSSLPAQNNFPVYEIRTDTALKQILGDDYWRLLPDKGGKWVIGDIIQSPLAGSFTRRDSVFRGGDTLATTSWINYTLQNVSGRTLDISLDANVERSEFYVFDSTGKYKHFLSGSLVPWINKDGLQLFNYIPLIMVNGERLKIYERLTNRRGGLPPNFSVDILNTASAIRENYVPYTNQLQPAFNLNDLQNIFLIGVLFMAMLFNLFFFLVSKEKAYGYFSLLLFSIAVARLINPGDAYLLYHNPVLEEKVGYLNLAWSLMLFSTVQFVLHFFNATKDYPGFSRFLVVTASVFALFNLVCGSIDSDYLLDVSTHLGWSAIFGIGQGLVFLSVTIVFLLYLRKQSFVRRLVILGGLPVILLWGIMGPVGAISVYLQSAYGIPLPAVLVNFPYWLYEIAFIVWFVVLFSFILFRQFSTLRKQNEQNALDRERMAKEKETERAQLIEQQKEELEKQVAARTTELSLSLEELRATQKQLIQSEKMASLGELTAGIAHEIQNPLNFVNNFSEVSRELIDELKNQQSNLKPAEQEEILNDINDNLAKINHHGKRADAIVKGMLLHSRSSSGQKEPTDINALCDEYLRLAYHGLRAKDKSFNATLNTDFDPSIGKINIVPQDIGRVVMNLLTNAFYAVGEKSKLIANSQQPTASYTPTVSISTKKIGDKIEIKVSDNGNGIPQNIIDKIFQPFFTTKPTGQGTGLGLSLSYDIVTKAHNGRLDVQSKEGEGTVFVIQLPIN